jgi:hypothetical protein
LTKVPDNCRVITLPMWQALALFVDPPSEEPTAEDPFLDVDGNGTVDSYELEVFNEVQKLVALADNAPRRPDQDKE